MPTRAKPNRRTERFIVLWTPARYLGVERKPLQCPLCTRPVTIDTPHYH